MINSKIIDEISSKINLMASGSPAADIEKNLRALLQGMFTKLELVSREEFDVQAQVLLRAREQLEALERRISELEQRLPG